MEDLSLHILDIAENSVAAGARSVEIVIEEDTPNDRLSVEIRDDGKGMEEELIERAADPFFTTRTVRRIGLGLPLLKQAAEECEGHFSILSGRDRGTIVKAGFRLSHIDRKPMGDIAATLMVLIAGNPEINFVLAYKRDDYSYRFETADIRRELGEIPINLPSVLKAIREDIDRGIGKSNPKK